VQRPKLNSYHHQRIITAAAAASNGWDGYHHHLPTAHLVLCLCQRKKTRRPACRLVRPSLSSYGTGETRRRVCVVHGNPGTRTTSRSAIPLMQCYAPVALLVASPSPADTHASPCELIVRRVPRCVGVLYQATVHYHRRAPPQEQRSPGTPVPACP
jgi:hypothetical protein